MKIGMTVFGSSFLALGGYTLDPQNAEEYVAALLLVLGAVIIGTS